MYIEGVGVNLQPNGMTSDLQKLENKLHQVIELGYDAVEIPIQGMNVIKNGEVDAQRLKSYVKLLTGLPLRYTTHAPYEMNLFYLEHQGEEQQLLMASLEVTAAIGAEVMVYHVGRYVPEEMFLYPRDWPGYSQDDKQQLLKKEQQVLQQLGDLAEKENVRIGMENMRPYLDCPHYCYSEIPHDLLRQVQAINHPNVGITLDVGHLYLASQMYSVDLLKEVEMIAPYVVHLHIHDNYGKPCYSWEKNQYALFPRGRGDMHMPIGDGAVPMASILEILQPSYHGFWINELRERYEGDWARLAESLDKYLLRAYRKAE